MTLLNAVAFLQQGPVESNWEAIKGALLSATVLLLVAACRLLWKQTVAIQQLLHIVIGTDGKNGLKAASRLHNARLDDLEKWQLQMDTAAAIERELYEGPDRRKEARRIRDKIIAEELRDKHSTEE